MIDRTVQDALTEIVGPDHVLGANRIANLDAGADPLNLGADLYLRPADTAEVAAILKLCSATGTVVVTQGGRTGLSGAARTRQGQVILSTERMDRIVEISPEERIAVVEAGATLQEVQEAAAAHGLMPGIDIAARGSATIGGMIATNAGGMEAWKFGMMRDRLLGMEVALPSGEVISDMTRVKKANEGYDLKQVFCGSEGTLGIVTKVVLRLEKQPVIGQTILAACPDAAAALRVMRALQDGEMLLRAELMWKSWAAFNADALGLSHVLTIADAPVYALYETDAGEDETLDRIAPFMEDGTIINALAAQSRKERDDLWRIREDSGSSRAIANRLLFDLSVPLSQLDAYHDGMVARLRAIDPTIDIHCLGHMGDGNLHLSAASDSKFTPDLKTAVSKAVEQGVKDFGGAISAEHGIGEDKMEALSRCLPPAALTAMRALKQAFDPAGVLNRGKIFT